MGDQLTADELHERHLRHPAILGAPGCVCDIDAAALATPPPGVGRELREALDYVSSAYARQRVGKLGPTGISAALGAAERALTAALGAGSTRGEPDQELRAAALALVDALPYEPGSMLGGKIALVRAALASKVSEP